jgi:hypothetical protein
MQLTNQIAMPASPEQLFTLLNDVERVAPCLPGAALEGRTEDDAFRGRVKVKVGPISAAYRGTVRFLEVDEHAKRLVLDAKGTDEHGSGSAEAKVTVEIRPDGQGSVLALNTDLVIRGKVAQFGRGAIGDVSQQLMERFAQNLGTLMAEPSAADGRGAQAAVPVVSQAGTERTGGDEAELDALSLVVRPMLKRFTPGLAALAVGVVAGVLAGRGRGSGGRRTVVDDIVSATVQIGAERFTVPARRTVRLIPRR